MDKKDKGQDKKKGFWAKLMENLDRKMEQKAKDSSCCGSGKKKGSSCC